MQLNPDPVTLEYQNRVATLLAEALPANWRGIGALSADERANFMERWRAFLREHHLVAPHWPKEYGGAGLSDAEVAVLNREFTRRGVPVLLSDNDASGFQLLGNLLLAYGTEEQKKFFLPRVISGEHLWCQGFSEPGSGSDLASLMTRARLEGGRWVINGQKLWTSAAHTANWIFMLVRTEPEAKRHRGLSLLLVPIDQSGVEVRPIKQMNGLSEFNEVFFVDAQTDAGNIVGGPGDGWSVAMTTLSLERGENASSMAIRFEEEFQKLVTLIRSRCCAADPLIRARLAERYLELHALKLLAMRSLSAFLEGRPPGPEAAIIKLFWSEYWQRTAELALDVLGDDAVAPTANRPPNADGPDLPGAANNSGSWVGTWLNSYAATIYSGTSEVQRNVIAERVLGLPK
jgi:alkylation response protein AidB-like acyl-CoA dehydrogenase